MFARTEQCGRHGHAGLTFDRFDRGAGGNPPMKRNIDDVVCRFGRHRLCRDRSRYGVVSRHRSGRPHHGIFRKLDHLQRTGPIGKAPDEAAFFECRDQAVYARLALQIERFLHFFEAGGNAGVFQTLLDEPDQFVLLGGQHCANSVSRVHKRRERMRNN